MIHPRTVSFATAVLVLSVAGAAGTGRLPPPGRAFTGDEASYIQALRADPHDDHALERLGVSLAQRGEWKKALDCYSLLVERRPRDIVVGIARARCLVRLGQHRRATILLQRILDTDPERNDAAALLKELGRDPGPTALATDAHQLAEIFQREHCLRHQAFVEKALATYNIEKGSRVCLTHENVASVLAELVAAGYMPRLYGEPTAHGEFRSRPDHRVWCTIHGGANREDAGIVTDPRAKLPRLARLKIPRKLLDEALAHPTASSEVALADLALRRRRPEHVARLMAGLKHVPDVADLELVLDDLSKLLAGASKVAMGRIDPPLWLLVHADGRVRVTAAILMERSSCHPAIGPDDAVALIARAAAGDLSTTELGDILVHVSATTKRRLATYVAAMPFAQATVAIPALARLKDKAILIALARLLPRYVGPAQMGRPVLLAALKEATGADGGEDAQAWIKLIEASVERGGEGGGE